MQKGSKMIKNVLVTGSEGYIGKHLCKMIEELRPDIKLFKLDINAEEGPSKQNIELPLKIEGRFHTVIHLAALVRVGESTKHPTKYYSTNTNGTFNIITATQPHNFIFASTGAAEYPESPYSLSKRMSEAMVKELCYDYTIFRFYNVIGTDGFPPTNPEGLMMNLMKAKDTGKFTIFGSDYNTKDGTCVREYVHVNDICSAIIKAIDEPANGIENLAYGDTRTTKEIASLFFKVNKINCNVEYGPRRPGDLESCYLKNPSKYITQKYSYEEMLKIDV
jgi:UDP-glucose 4-epimerase